MNPNKNRVDTHVISRKKRRRSPQQERSRVTVEAILEAAGLLLVETGYAGASTNAIAKRAGVSIGSLYQYFPNKESIFLALLERHHAEMQPIQARAVAELAEGGTVAGVLEDVMRRSLAVRQRDPTLMTALHRELAGLAMKHELEGETDFGRGVEILSLILMARKDLPDTFPRERAWLMITILEAVGRRMVHESLPDLDRETLISLTVNACGDILAK